jgi:hypothetical protein
MLEIAEIDKPFRDLSYGLLANEVKRFGISINQPFAVFTDKTKLWTNILSRAMPWLLKTEKALQDFRERIGKIENTRQLYLKIREAYGRTPAGYIVDIRVIIPDSNREIEYQVYDAFGELLEMANPLLFDLHIIRLKGRKLEEAIPKGFWRYGWMSDYIY